jgi:hypothetical protein
VIALGDGPLRATVLPEVGGAIASVRLGPHEVLGRVPWRPVAAPLPSGAARDEAEWLTRYTGGWPLMFPNAGDACTAGGMVHGFHGEASVTAWEAEPVPGGVALTRRFAAVPAAMRREVTIDGDILTVRETAEAHAPCRAMWGQHVTFGSDLLTGPVTVRASARRVVTDDLYNPPQSPLLPGAEGAWPLLPGRTGPVDLSRPAEGAAFLAYLSDLTEPAAAIRRADGLEARLSWEGVFESLWFWCELAATPDPPWDRRARLIGLEPCSTPRAHGLADAAGRGLPLAALEPGRPVTAITRLRILPPG